MEALRLHRLPGRLGISEYFEFGLADSRRFTWDDKTRFLGYASHPLYSRLNAPGSHALANDKVYFHSVMSSAGLAITEVQAIYCPGGRAFAGAVNCADVEALHQFLVRDARFPLFVKPADGVFGKGAHWVLGYDPQERTLHCKNEAPVALQSFVDAYGWHLRYGLLLQSVVQPHADMVPLCGARVSSVRCQVLLADDGPQLLCANWKVPTGDNIVDNTGGWANGNMVAGVDVDTGEILSLWRGQDGRAVPAQRHPDTGVDLRGRHLPLWPQLRQYVTRAAVQFPELRLQGWDIVPSENGILSFEVNLVTEATVFANQLVHGRGLLDERLRNALGLRR